MPLDLTVRRRYTDFEWLRNILTKLYPGIYIPPLPKRQIDYNTSDEKIEKKMRQLNRFITSLIEDELLMNSEILYLFLSSNSSSPLEDQYKQYKDLEENNIHLTKYRSRTGKILIDKTLGKNIQYFKDMNTNIDNNISELSKLSKSFKALANEITAVNKRYLEISKIFNNLYNMSIKNGENENLIKSYKNMKMLIEGLGYNELKLSKNIELNIREYFKYVKSEYYAQQELYEKYYYSLNLYTKNTNNLLKKKEQLYIKKDTSKWELAQGVIPDLNDKKDCFNKMLRNETIQNNNLRNFFLYMANQCKNEFVRLREVVGFQNREKMKDFYNNNYKVLEELNKIWTTFGSYN